VQFQAFYKQVEEPLSLTAE